MGHFRDLQSDRGKWLTYSMFNYWMAGSGPAKAGQDIHLFFKITLLIAGKFQEKKSKIQC